MILYGGYSIYRRFFGPQRFGQGAVSYKNQEELKKEIDRLATEIDVEKLPKDNIFYKNIANSLYQILNNDMFAIDFGLFTKYTQFPKIVNLLNGLNAEELKQVVVEYGTRPRSFLFEFGTAGSLFDWFERMLTISQLDILSKIFDKSKLWRTPKFRLDVINLFSGEANRLNANNWNPWINTSNTHPRINRLEAYAIAGNTAELFIYSDKYSFENSQSRKPIDSFRPLSYSKPTLIVFGSYPTTNKTNHDIANGGLLLIAEVVDNIVSKNGENLKGQIIAVDARYFNKTKPNSAFLSKFNLS
jgi:hypothetical protein